MTDDEVAAIAKKHGGRFLLSRADWKNVESASYIACRNLVVRNSSIPEGERVVRIRRAEIRTKKSRTGAPWQ